MGRAKKQNLKEINVQAVGQYRLPLSDEHVWFSSQFGAKTKLLQNGNSTQYETSEGVPPRPTSAGGSWVLGLAHRWALAQPLPSLGLVPCPLWLCFGHSSEAAACPRHLLTDSTCHFIRWGLTDRNSLTPPRKVAHAPKAATNPYLPSAPHRCFLPPRPSIFNINHVLDMTWDPFVGLLCAGKRQHLVR